MKAKYLFGIEEAVEEKLRQAQEHKVFKDAGVRVAGSKKEKRARKSVIASADLQALEADEATAMEMVTKDRVWPKYDIAEERERGVMSGCAFLKVKLRAAFAAKPPIQTKATRLAYVVLAEKAQQLFDRYTTVQNFYGLWDDFLSWGESSIDTFLFVPQDFSDKDKEFLTKHYPNWNIRNALQQICGKEFYNLLSQYGSRSSLKTWDLARHYNGVSAEQAARNLEAWNTQQRSIIADYEEKIPMYRLASTSKLKELRFGWKHIPKDAESFRTVAINYMVKKIEDAKRKIDNLPEDRKQREPDWSWADGSGKKREKTSLLTINQGKPLEFIKRTGGLEITTVKEKEIIKLFGFRAVEFGNAIRDAEAREHVRHFLGSCSDLFEVLNYDAKTINQLGGGLAIAFGSRGSGKAAATYYPMRQIINVTNKRGDGSIAHEWSHYLDNRLYHLLCFNQGSNEPFATAHLARLNPGPVSNALNNLMHFIFKGDGQYKTVKMRFFPSDRRSYFFKGETVEEAISYLRMAKEYLFTDMYTHSQRDAHRMFGYVAHKLNLPFLDVDVKIHRTSAYYYYSQRVGSKYWIDPAELFARAFETYAYDKLIASRMFNNYLVSGDYFDHELHVYPYGYEREKLFTLFDTLIKAIAEQFEIPSFVPHTERRTDEYIALDEDEDEETVETGVVSISSLSELLRLELNLYKVA